MHIGTICKGTVISELFYTVTGLFISWVLLWAMISMVGIERIACYILESKLCTCSFNIYLKFCSHNM